MTVATEERLNRSPTTPTAATRLTAEAAAEAAATPPPPAATPPPPAATPPPPAATSTTPAATPPPPAATSTTPEAATGPAVTWRLGDYEPGQPRPLPLTTERFLQPRRLVDPPSLGASHHRHIQLRRQFGYTPRVQDTMILPVLHKVNRQTTQRPMVQLTGNQGPARASSATANTSRPIGDSPRDLGPPLPTS